MKTLVGVLATIVLFSPPAAAQQTGGTAAEGGVSRQQRVEEVANRLPDLSETPDAAQQLGVSEAHSRAATAALDAARLSQEAGSDQGCLTMADAAATVLTEGGYSETAEGMDAEDRQTQ